MRAIQSRHGSTLHVQWIMDQRKAEGLGLFRHDRCSAQGRWYITAGLNPLFDTFDCQEHFFGVPEPGKLYGKINWRIPKGNSDFIERSTVQTFDQVGR